jgi:serine/threonine protein kinase
MHSQGILHRDLKPENIMFKSKNISENLKIVDFGFSTKESLDKFLFPQCGTPGYVAPEIANLADDV